MTDEKDQHGAQGGQFSLQGGVEAMLRELLERQGQLQAKFDHLERLLQVGPSSHDRRLEKLEERAAACDERLSRVEGARDAEAKATSLDKRLLAYDGIKWILGLAIAAAVAAYVSGQVKGEPLPTNKPGVSQVKEE